MLQIWDCMAERGEFELPVPISEQPDGNMMSGPRCPNEVSGSSEAQARGRLIRSATFEGDLHSYAMNDVATDVAAAIQMKGQAILPGHSQRPQKRTRNALRGDSAFAVRLDVAKLPRCSRLTVHKSVPAVRIHLENLQGDSSQPVDRFVLSHHFIEMTANHRLLSAIPGRKQK